MELMMTNVLNITGKCRTSQKRKTRFQGHEPGPVGTLLAMRLRVFLPIIVSLLMVFCACSSRPPMDGLPVQGGPETSTLSNTPDPAYFRGTLKVITLNMAHGRNTAFSQIFQRATTTQKNLQRIASLLKRVDADIVALQEADGPSWWSGDFDHVARVAGAAGYPWFSRAEHVSSWSLHYGTALLSHQPFVETRAHTFQPSPPTTNKGFLLGRFGWLPHGDSDTPVFIDILSVHLDFSRANVREEQIEEMAGFLAGRGNPLIIMGDLNSEWLADGSVVQELSSRSGLQVFRPLAEDLGTYSSSGRRLDWILISSELEFKRYAVQPDVVSDHFAVVAEIAMKPSG
jgi:endonuclease/exonuclease/phosphatase family metal-dependent hydrolase